MRGTRTKLVIIFVVIAVLAVIYGLVISSGSSSFHPPPLPNPNGYTAFVQASQLVSKTNDSSAMNESELRALVEQNTNALQLVRSNLDEQCQVPLDFNAATMSPHMPDLAGFKALALAFSAEGKLAEMEQRPADAAKSYFDTIHFGVQSPRGGLIIDALVGIAIEAIGTGNFEKLVGQLDAKTCRDFADKLETLDQQRQTWEQVMQQEHYWSNRAFPSLQYRLVRLVMYRTTKKVEAISEKKFKARQLNTEKLMVILAARADELENGHRPASITDLVPTYLKKIPQDPLTGSNLTLPP